MNGTFRHIALLIDADNVSAAHIDSVLTELARSGRTTVRRMYGDWTSTQLSAWKEVSSKHALQPIQQFAHTTGKNSTDSALIIDAMDLLHQTAHDAFAIVSSDSDFTRLASRLRESGAHVFGFGERKTPGAFREACDTFKYFDALQVDVASPTPEPVKSATEGSPKVSPSPQPPQRKTGKQLRSDALLMNLIRQGIKASSDEDGWANLSTIGSWIQKNSTDFDSRNWGYAKLSELIKAIGTSQFEMKLRGSTNGPKVLKVRVPAEK